MPSLWSYPLRFLLNYFKGFGDERTTIEQLRRRGDAAMGWVKPPASVSVQAVQVGGIPAEWVIPRGAPPESALLYFHGGAFILGSLNTHRNIVTQLALASGTRVLSVAYRLAPENPFPAGLEDCLAAYHGLVQAGIAARKIVVAGDSAGGNLALVLLLALRQAGEELPGAAVCLSPVTDMEGTLPSRRLKAAVDPVLGKGFGNTGFPHCYMGSHDFRNPLISPLFADLRGLPPILIHAGEDEILLDENVEFVEKACSAGVEAQVVVWPHMWHVFQMFAPTLPEARQSVTQMGAFIRQFTHP